MPLVFFKTAVVVSGLVTKSIIVLIFVLENWTERNDDITFLGRVIVFFILLMTIAIQRNKMFASFVNLEWLS